MVLTRCRSSHSSLTVRSSVSSLVARAIGPIRTSPVLRSTTVTTQALPRPCIVSISQSPIRPRVATTAGLCSISLTGQPSAAVISPIPLAPALPGSPQVPPQVPFTSLIPPNPTIDRLVAHHPLPLKSSPPNHLLGAKALPNQCLNGLKLHRPIPPVPPGTLPSSASFLHRMTGTITAIMHRLIALHLPIQCATMPPKMNRHLCHPHMLPSHGSNLITFLRA